MHVTVPKMAVGFRGQKPVFGSEFDFSPTKTSSPLSELPPRSPLCEIRESSEEISQGSFGGLSLSGGAGSPIFVPLEGWHGGLWSHIGNHELGLGLGV